MSRRSLIALLLLLALTAGIRSSGITRPLLGNFATRNVVNAMMARNWALGRASAWRPKVDVLADGQRAFHLVEVPISAYVAGGLWRLLGGSLDVWGRAISIFFSTISVALMFFLVRRWHGTTAAWAASVVLALSPVSVIYGQGFMLEPSVVCLTLATLLGWTLWLEGGRWPLLAMTAVALSMLLLTKLYMLVLLLPLAAMFVHFATAAERRQSIARGASPWSRERKMIVVSPGGASVPAVSDAPSELRRVVGHWFQGLTPLAIDCRRSAAGTRLVLSIAVIVIAVIPASIWYWHVREITTPGSPAADRVHFSIRSSAATHTLPHPVLAKPDFYRQVLDDLAGVALTPVAFVLALFGLAHRQWRRQLPWLAGMAVLVLVLPLKFYKMNYYYLVVLPPLCVLAGLGWQVIYERLKTSPRWVMAVLLIGLVFSARHSIKPAFVTPEEDRGVLAAAEAIQELTEPDEPVATIHGSTVDLLYYCDRPGRAISPGSSDLASRLADCREQGVKYVAVAGIDNMDSQATRRLARLRVVRQGEDFRVFRLEPGPARLGN